MEPIDIIVLVASIIIVASVLGRYIYRKSKKMTTGDCACCTLKTEKTLKKIRRELKKSKKLIRE